MGVAVGRGKTVFLADERAQASTSKSGESERDGCLQPSLLSGWFLIRLSNTVFWFFFLNFIFKLYIIILVLPNIKMNLPQVYMCSPS